MKLAIKSLLLLTLFLFAKSLAAENIVEDGAFYLQEKQYDKAITLLQAELLKKPNDAKINFQLGEAYFALGKMDAAKVAYTSATSDLKSAYGFLGLGKSELQNGNRVAALALFDKSLKLDKKNPSLYALVAKACIEVSKVDTAAARIYLERGAAVSNKNAMIQLILGDYNLAKKNYGAAANDYERVLLYDKSSYVAYRSLGVLYTAAKNFGDAKRNFEESLRLAPNQILGYKEFSELYYIYGKYVEAKKHYSLYYSKVNPTIDETERYAFILFFNKEYKEASDLLNKVLKEKGESASVAIYRLQGYICSETGLTAEGVEYMQKLFTLKAPSDLLSSDYGYYARLLAKNNQDSLAIINYRAAIAKEDEPVDYLEELAKVYVKGKQFDSAIVVYSTIMASGGAKSAGNFNMGKAFYQKGDDLRTKLYAITPIADSKGRVAPMPVEAELITSNMIVSYNLADSCFAIVNTLSPTYATGFLWRGRIQSILDPESKLTRGKEFFEKTLEIIEASGDKAKSKKLYIECYNYLGSYYYLNSERAKGSEAKQLKDKSISYFQLILDLEPTDAVAKDKIEKLKVSSK